MLAASLLALLGGLSSTSVLAAGTECGGSTGPLTGTAADGDPFWYEAIEKQGTAPFASAGAGYKVFRNVKDYGAVGDGNADDTAAIQKAIDDGDRCGVDCKQSSTTPAVVYFPQGTYVVSKPLISDYYTAMVGDAKNWPTLKAAAGLSNDGTGYNVVIEADPYIPGGNGENAWTNQNNFYRAVRNFNIDLTAVPAGQQAKGVHWQVSQATSLMNVNVKMTEGDGADQVGIYMESGSGGFASDITCSGGYACLHLGNQQFTFRNVKATNSINGVLIVWNWGMSFMDVSCTGATNCFNITTGGDIDAQTAGGAYILDSSASNCQAFVSTTTAQPDTLAGSIVIDNAQLDNTAGGVVSAGNTVLEGGSTKIDLWAQGSIYAADGTRTYKVGPLDAYTKPAGLLDSNGKVFGKSRPLYESFKADQFTSVKAEGAKGDGTTDDTAAIQSALDKYAGCKVIFIDAGEYIVTDTIKVPVGTAIVGEYFPTLLASGDAFGDAQNPKVMVQVGQEGDEGTLEISDVMFSVTSGARGTTVVEWNVAGDAGAVGMWDAHVRQGGAKGTNILVGNCANTTSPAPGGACDGGFLGLHITKQASAYLSATWVWTADHDIEDPTEKQINVFSGRGILHEATKPSWYLSTAAEHQQLYQYNFLGASTVFMSVPQTESPYMQPNPAPAAYDGAKIDGDPTFPDGVDESWSMLFQGSKDIIVASAGLYSFFRSYDQACIKTFDCQSQLVNIDDQSSGIRFYNLNTVGATDQIGTIVHQADNRNGFASTATFYASDGSSSSKSSSGASASKMRVRRTPFPHADRAFVPKHEKPAMW